MNYTIIGAGIGGLTLGVAFQKSGLDYKIYERFSEVKDVGAGIALSPNALQVLEYFDVLEQVKSRGNEIDRITIGQTDLTPISDIQQEEVKAKFGFSTIAIHRAELQSILLERIPGDKIFLGKQFVSYKMDESSKIESQFSDGTSVLSDYLIGADGINSKVRDQLFPNCLIRYSGQTCWRGVAQVKLNSDFDHRVYELWGEQIRFGIARISDEKYYWFAVSIDKPNQKDDQKTVKSKLLKMFSEFHPVVDKLLSNTPDELIIRNDITDLKPLTNWYQKSICLIGDAGHATTPNMGQGGAQAIEDAYYLSHLQSTEPNENVFGKFQKKRQSKVNSIVIQSWNTGKVAHWKYGCGLRNFALKSIPEKLLLNNMMKLFEIEKYPTNHRG